ncbi:MAG: zinc-binding dehydrogenase [Thermoplasmata archaeon]|nr:zinc-binding dehydrogenase [Thermoplasmata archaeon]
MAVRPRACAVIGFGFTEHGNASRLGWVTIPEPVPGPEEVRVRLHAAAFNRLDRFVLEGIPGVPIERPHVLGGDGAGVVDALGESVTDLAPGDRVLINPGLWDASCEACRKGQEALCRSYQIVGEHTQGTMTERVVVPRRNLHRIPEPFDDAEAAALPLVYQTAWRALLTVGELGRGERVAIIGAGGGVAPAVLQLARLLGGEVTVLSRSPEKLERAAALGAAQGVLLPPGGSIDQLLWTASGKRGFDLIFDSVGEASVPRSVRALARGGRLVVIGATTGPMAALDLRTLFWRQASIRGSTMASRSEFAAMLEAVTAAALHPVIDSRFPFAEARAAFERFASPAAFGKVVVEHPA